MTEQSWTFSVPLVPHVPQEKKDRIGQKCVSQTHVHTVLRIAKILMWKKAVKRLCLAGRRLYLGQAGRHLELTSMLNK